MKARTRAPKTLSGAYLRHYADSERARCRRDPRWVEKARDPGTRKTPLVEEAHRDPVLGLGWRWRLQALLDLNPARLTQTDLAWGIKHGDKPRTLRDGRKGDDGVSLSNLKQFLSGLRALNEKNRRNLVDFLVGQMHLDPEAGLDSPARSLGAFRRRPLTLVEAPVVHARVRLEKLDSRLPLPRDDRRQALTEDLWRFLDLTSDSVQAAGRKPVFLIYGEHDRLTQCFVRRFLELYSENDEPRRAIVAIDARGTDATKLAEALLEDGEGTPDQHDVVRNATLVKDRLEREPAIVVISHFEPVLVGLDGASVHAAIRNTGFHDMFSRIVHGLDPRSRFIVVVDHLLTRIDASYLHDVRLFTGLRPDHAQVSDWLEHTARRDRLDEPLRLAIVEAGRYPGDTLAAVLRALRRGHRRGADGGRWPSETWYTAVVRGNALHAAVDACVASLAVPWSRSVLLAAALAEDKVEMGTLHKVLERVGAAPEEQARDETHPSLADVVQTCAALGEALPDLAWETSVSEPGLSPESVPVLDLDPQFRDALLAHCEEPGRDQETLDWCRRVRRAVAGIAHEHHLTLMASNQDASVEDRPAVFRRGILSIVLKLASIDPRGIGENDQARSGEAASERARTGPTADEALVQECYADIAELERGAEHRLSASYVGNQLKLQLWLRFQHPGRARPSFGVRQRVVAGPSLRPPEPVPGFSREQNVEMLVSLALGALGAFDLDYCDAVLRSADVYLARDPRALEDPAIQLRIVKLWKCQCDLLVFRAQLDDAERFLRQCLMRTRYPDGVVIEERSVDELDASLESERGDGARSWRWLAWARLLARLGRVLSTRGDRRVPEAIAAFEMALLCDEAGAARNRTLAHTPAMAGKPARWYLRLLCHLARTDGTGAERAQGLVREAKDIRRRLLQRRPDSPREKVAAQIDDAVLTYTEAVAGSDARAGLDAVERVATMLDVAEKQLVGLRLHGLEEARIPRARSLLIAHCLGRLAVEIAELRDGGAERARALVTRVERDSARCAALIRQHDAVPSDRAPLATKAPLLGLDVAVAGLVARGFATTLLPDYDPTLKTSEKREALRGEFSKVRATLHVTGHFEHVDLLRAAERFALRPDSPSRARTEDRRLETLIGRLFTSLDEQR